MKHILASLGLVTLLALGGCQQAATAVSTACADIAAMPPAATAALDAQDAHIAIGVLWADAKSACANGVPVAGVTVSWGAMVWNEVKALIPQVLPSLLPLVVGLL